MIDATLITHYQRWEEANDFPGYPTWAYPSEALGIETQGVAAILTLVWPEFVVIDDHVLLSGNFDDVDLQNFIHDETLSRADVERELNHVHLFDFACEINSEHKLGINVLETLASVWSNKLKQDFPDRSFVVDVWTEEPVGITFSQDR